MTNEKEDSTYYEEYLSFMYGYRISSVTDHYCSPDDKCRKDKN